MRYSFLGSVALVSAALFACSSGNPTSGGDLELSESDRLQRCATGEAYTCTFEGPGGQKICFCESVENVCNTGYVQNASGGCVLATVDAGHPDAAAEAGAKGDAAADDAVPDASPPAVCGAGGLKCLGPQVASCVNGQWVGGTICDNGCTNGICNECDPRGDYQCLGSTFHSSCTSNGKWADTTTCEFGCVTTLGQRASGEFQQCRVCAHDGDKRCGATGVEVCDQGLDWYTQVACPLGCQNSACIECLPGQSQCVHGDPNDVVQTCVGGKWTTASECLAGSSTPVCSAGKCTACSPGAIECASSDSQRTCDANGNWLPLVTCPSSKPACEAGSCQAPPSCPAGGGNGISTCGPSSNENCCVSPLVTGGTFMRQNAAAATPATNPATVSSFRLDKYEITVGRFRQFVKLQTTTVMPTNPDVGWQPLVGDGKHVHLSGGKGLVDALVLGGHESGWSQSQQQGWSMAYGSNEAAWDKALTCDALATWTSAAGANESRPINCITQLEAAAFCVWDGGFLPTEAEWGFAAAGGSEQRTYPWSTTAAPATIDGNHASFMDASGHCVGDGAAACALSDLVQVGSKVAGVGKWGQADLAGNVAEWTSGGFVEYGGTASGSVIASYVTPCVDCTYDVWKTTENLKSWEDRYLAFANMRGGSFKANAMTVKSDTMAWADRLARSSATGARCARTP